MPWAEWDNESNAFRGVVRALPDTLEGRDPSTLALMGYREIVTRHPENFVARFPALLGISSFRLLEDGRVEQTFPNADYSVARVREELTRQMKDSAGRELARTDWYIVRSVELGEEVPAEIGELRTKIRDHVDWLEEQIAGLSPRELVDYQWRFPQNAEQELINGVPVELRPGTEESIREDQLPLKETAPPDGGVIPPGDARLWVTGHTEPLPAPGPMDPLHDVAPPPPTTDGPVPTWVGEDRPPTLDANGFPLVHVYDNDPAQK